MALKPESKVCGGVRFPHQVHSMLWIANEGAVAICQNGAQYAFSGENDFEHLHQSFGFAFLP